MFATYTGSSSRLKPYRSTISSVYLSNGVRAPRIFLVATLLLIDHSGTQVLMAHEFLNRPDVITIFQ